MPAGPNQEPDRDSDAEERPKDETPEAAQEPTLHELQCPEDFLGDFDVIGYLESGNVDVSTIPRRDRTPGELLADEFKRGQKKSSFDTDQFPTDES